MAETIAVIDYGSGNLRSCAKALERAASDASLPSRIEITSDVDAIYRADRVVLPGVGAFADCMAGLSGVAGLKDALIESVIEKRKPFLGICVGMQLMSEVGVEFGRHEGLGWLKGEVTRLDPPDASLKIPHMGWNTLTLRHDHPVTAGLDGAHVYFVHSYALQNGAPDEVLGVCDYGVKFAAVAGRDNMIGTQFHPEKSQQAGLTLLTQFLKWRP
ncbi:MAG: imidazole glycerol phosphate synthase subunit HisH [Micropepsaceae bacterium]